MSIHPFNFYKIYKEIQTHFTSKKFIYGKNSLSNIRYSDFYKIKNHVLFEKFSHRVKNDIVAEDLCIANFLQNPSMSIYEFTFNDPFNAKKEWYARLNNIPYYMKKEIKSFLEYSELHTFKKLVKYLYKYSKEIEQKNVTASSIFDNVDVTKNSIHDIFLYEFSPEVIVVINDIIKKKYNYDFLKMCVDNKKNPKQNYMKLFKYSFFIDLKNVRNYNIYEKFLMEA